jgi:hypothetical protein
MNWMGNGMKRFSPVLSNYSGFIQGTQENHGEPQPEQAMGQSNYEPFTS